MFLPLWADKEPQVIPSAHERAMEEAGCMTLQQIRAAMDKAHYGPLTPGRLTAKDYGDLYIRKLVGG